MPLDPPSIKEKFRGLQGYGLGTTGGAIEVPFLVRGFTDETLAADYALASAPRTRGLYVLESVARFEAMDPDAGVWEFAMRYVPAVEGAPLTGMARFSFRTSGGTQHIKESITTVNRYLSEDHIGADHGGAIGVTADGNVEGCDIVAGQFEWTETWRFFRSDITTEFMGKLFRLTGKTNDGPFRFCDTGEVLFLGAEGGTGDLLAQTQESTIVEISLNYAASENRDDIEITGIEDPIEKQGWEYLWCEYQQSHDDVSKPVGTKILQVNIEQVYFSDDLESIFPDNVFHPFGAAS